MNFELGQLKTCCGWFVAQKHLDWYSFTSICQTEEFDKIMQCRRCLENSYSYMPALTEWMLALPFPSYASLTTFCSHLPYDYQIWTFVVFWSYKHLLCFEFKVFNAELCTFHLPHFILICCNTPSSFCTLYCHFNADPCQFPLSVQIIEVLLYFILCQVQILCSGLQVHNKWVTVISAFTKLCKASW